MSKVKSIIKLYTQGVSKKSISERVSLPRNSVKKYIRLFLASGRSPWEIEGMGDADLEQMFLKMSMRSHLEDKDRYKSLIKFFPIMEKALKVKGTTKSMLWQQYYCQNPGGYMPAQFKYHYRLWQRARHPVMHIEHKAGEKSCSQGSKPVMQLEKMADVEFPGQGVNLLGPVYVCSSTRLRIYCACRTLFLFFIHM